MLSCVNFNLDTLFLNVQRKLDDELFGRLHFLKEAAKEEEHEIGTPWSFNDKALFIRPSSGGVQWPFVLFNDDIHLDIGKGKLNGNCCKMRCSSLYLHASDPADCVADCYRFASSFFGDPFTLQVSEVHVCADIAGWVLTLDDGNCFVTRSRRVGTHLDEDEPDILVPARPNWSGRHCTGFEFSKKAVHSCIIYDKTREVKPHNKKWFYEIWKAHGWDEVAPVIRVEFRYDRTCLHEMDIEEPFDMLENLSRMWGYSTQKWLRHTQPQDDETQSRWPLSPVWEVVQASMQYGDPTPLARTKKIELDADRSMAGFVGYATSWAVRSGLPLSVVQEDGGGFMEWSFAPMQAYLEKRKEATFVDVMREKAFRIGLKLSEGSNTDATEA